MSEPDFNLLRIFDMLMDQRSVSRTAERLRITQSAVSHALRRLRIMLGDPLFVRSPQGLIPTPRAEEIAPGIRDGFDRVKASLSPPQFDPGEASRRFTVAAGSYFCDLLIPSIVRRIQQEAPRLSLRVVPITDAIVQALDRGSVDLVLGGSALVPPRFVQEVLFEEAFVWVAGASHPIGEGAFDPDAVDVRRRIAVSIHRPWEDRRPSEAPIAKVYPNLLIEAEQGADDGRIVVYDAQTALNIVVQTDAIAMIPRRVAEPAARSGRARILSTTTVSTSVAMLWHSKQRNDAGLTWLRALVRELAA